MPLYSIDWWTIRDSNPGPTGYEPVALTNWANGPKRKKDTSPKLFKLVPSSPSLGDPWENRTPDAGVRGRSLNRLTNGPVKHTIRRTACSSLYVSKYDDKIKYRWLASSHSCEQVRCIMILLEFWYVVHHRGLEPRTHWLRVSCSTIWANGAYKVSWSIPCLVPATTYFPGTLPSKYLERRRA